MITYEKEVIIWECITFTEETKTEIEKKFECTISINDCDKDSKIISYVLSKTNGMYLLYIGNTVCYDRFHNKLRIKY